MFSKAIFLTFLSVALSAYAAPANQHQKSEVCASVSTVVVTALPSATTGVTLINTGNGNGRGGNNAGNGRAAAGNGRGGKGGNKAASSAVAVSSVVASATASPVATVRVGGNTGNGNGQGGKGGNKGGNQASSVVATSAAAGTAVASSAVSSASAAATSLSAASGNGNNNNNDPQSSLTLDPGVLAKGFENNGQDVPTAGQVASLTSDNNFINFCLTVPNLPITNGQQVKTGSCNPAPMGIIAATTNMPSGKFQFPTNLATIKANTAFTIKMAISHLETGNFVNAQENYFSAPQQINGAGDVQGHSHVVIEQIDSFQQTTPTNPNVFAFFKGLNDAAQGGVLSADVTNGLPAGFYRLASINTAANHQPVLVAVAQHGSLDDMVYFQVTADGNAAGNGNGAGAAASAGGGAAASSAAASASSAAATASAGTGNNKNNGGGKNQASATAAASSAAVSASASAATGNNKNNGGGKAQASATAAAASTAAAQASASAATGNKGGKGTGRGQGGQGRGRRWFF